MDISRRPSFLACFKFFLIVSCLYLIDAISASANHQDNTTDNHQDNTTAYYTTPGEEDASRNQNKVENFNPKLFITSKNSSNCNLTFFDSFQLKNLNCTMDDYTANVSVPKQIWLGIIRNGTDKVYIMSPHCPPEYCKESIIEIDPDGYFDENKHCSNGRKGILCGQCIEGYSVTYGDNYCKKCSNKYWPPAIILVGLVGLLLVLVIGFFDITVANGPISVIIFYTNVVKANEEVIFTHNTWFGRVLAIWICNCRLG